MIEWKDNDEAFKQFLATGHKWEDYVVGQLRGLGFYARADADRGFRESIDDSPQYKDQIDITVLDRDYEYIRIEVKSVALDYYTPGDFPFAAPIVTTVGSWDNCSDDCKPHVVVCVSQVTGAMMALNTERTLAHWRKELKYDAKRHIDDWFYVCDRRHWRGFDALVRWLEPQCNRFTVHGLNIPEPDPSKLKERR